jgi:hypothetical protein
LAWGALTIVRTRKSDTAGQGPAGLFVVIVSVTVPAVMSAALGAYVVERLEALPKVPVPDVVHVVEIAEPPLVPVIVAEVFEHIV